MSTTADTAAPTISATHRARTGCPETDAYLSEVDAGDDLEVRGAFGVRIECAPPLFSATMPTCSAR